MMYTSYMGSPALHAAHANIQSRNLDEDRELELMEAFFYYERITAKCIGMRWEEWIACMVFFYQLVEMDPATWEDLLSSKKILDRDAREVYIKIKKMFHLCDEGILRLSWLDTSFYPVEMFTLFRMDAAPIHEIYWAPLRSLFEAKEPNDDAPFR